MTSRKRGSRRGSRPATINPLAAQRLREAATLLEEQGDNPFRVNAYRRAASAIEGLDVDLSVIVERGGTEALQQISDVGESIAASLDEITRTGRWSYLDRLRGQTDPEDLFCTVPGIGLALAQRLHDTLNAETLDQLEAALLDPACRRVPGLGPKRRAALAEAVARILRRSHPRHAGRSTEPDVDLLLAVDAEYRRQALAGALHRIAPRRFNPKGDAWLPVMHKTIDGWHFTALYSNTARAHELGKTRDWVVLYFHAANGPESQRTVVTETHGDMAGQRVVRGREAECSQGHAAPQPAPRRNGTEA